MAALSQSADDAGAHDRQTQQRMLPVAQQLQRMTGMADVNAAKLDLIYTVGQHMIQQQVEQAEELAQAALAEALWTYTHHRSGCKDWTPRLLRNVFISLDVERKKQSHVQARSGGGQSACDPSTEQPRAPKREKEAVHRNGGARLPQKEYAKRPRHGQSASGPLILPDGDNGQQQHVKPASASHSQAGSASSSSFGGHKRSRDSAYWDMVNAVDSKHRWRQHSSLRKSSSSGGNDDPSASSRW